MIAGIIGAEGAKFTLRGEIEAKVIIHNIIANPEVTEVCSGECHLGGVDIWAREETHRQGKKFTPFPPATLSWPGYKARNLKIAAHSDVVHNIVVDKLPPEFRGMTFARCYHCNTNAHVKSGGCWTAKKAKQGIWHVVMQ